MSDIHVYIIVEGQTEQTFIRDVLAPEMAYKQIYMYPSLLGVPGRKGGDVKFERAKRDIEKFLKQMDSVYVSTMFDYFKIDSGWPGKRLDESQQKQLDSFQKAEIIKTSTLQEIKKSFLEIDVENRFIPYFSIFEFEALLFSDTAILASELGINDKLLKEITDKYDHPEEINDGINTAPSKRLLNLCNDYKKVLYGKSISQKIGISNIRNKCPNFNKWLNKLESLKN